MENLGFVICSLPSISAPLSFTIVARSDVCCIGIYLMHINDCYVAENEKEKRKKNLEKEMEEARGSDEEREEDESMSDLLRDRFRLAAISVAEAEAKKNGMEISSPIVACLADLAFKFTAVPCLSLLGKEMFIEHFMCHSTQTSISLMQENLLFKAEQLAKDLELFAQHAGRKSVNMEDVVLAAHRNEHLASSLRSFGDGLKAKEPQSERKRKKALKKSDKGNASMNVVDIPDI